MYLNCHTYYSFKYGTMSPKELLCEAEIAYKHTRKAKKNPLLALTDINSTSGCLYHALECQNRGWPVILGVDFRKGAQQYYIAIAQNNKGFQHINTHLSDILHEKKALEPDAPTLPYTFIIYPFSKTPDRALYPNEYIGVDHTELFTFQKKQSHHPQEKYVALNTVTFRHKRDYNAHRLLRGIDNNILLSRLSPEQQGQLYHRFYSYDELHKRFDGYHFLLTNTIKLLAQCSLHFNFNDKTRLENKKHFGKSTQDDHLLLEKLAKEGLNYRYGTQISQEVTDRLEKELRVIKQCNFVPYFLINHNIVSYARSQGYFYVGRGSGANSLVAYLLRITNVDPIELNLYFERFINPSRKSPPDFDIDFSWRDRQDVTRYIFDTFHNTALLGSFVTFQRRSVIREIGKVLGLPADEIKVIQQTKNTNNLDHISKLCVLYSQHIHGLPSHLSIHSSGIVITERPIHHFCATSLPPKGFPTAHFDMHIAEDAGIYKYDILGQRGLAKIKDAISIIHTNRPDAPPFDIDDVARFKEDEKIKDLLRRGDAIGCFYVESPAMRGLMKKLEIDDYKGLVAASSIIRPGVSNSGMMGEYIRRHRSQKARMDIHPVLGEILKDTYGVMVYQEDVLKIAHYFAKLTLEESDILRRGMSWKFRERTEFKTVKKLFFDNCKKEGYDAQLVSEIWKQIESFANYAFAKGHSASYAVESYQSLFLKAYYPLEYMVATINNGGGFYRTEQYLQEARLKGGKVEAPCVNRSEAETIISGETIYIGFLHIKELESNVTQKLLQERAKEGPFLSLKDFVYRTGISLEMLIILIRIGAFRFTKKSKSWLLWKAHFLLGKQKKATADTHLFREYQPAQNIEIPDLTPMHYEDAIDEMEYLGFTLCSPFDLIEERYLRYTISYRDFPHLIGESVTMIGYLIHVKRTSTKGKLEQEMGFGTFMDREGTFFDSVHFPQIYAKYKFTGKGIYIIQGTITSQYDYLSLEANYMKRLPYDKLK